jgi:Nif-specific regulatory protein
MTLGSRAGVSFLLDPTEENRIGRDTECAIALNDPLCSRVHAIIVQQSGIWRIRDAQSRNGTFVNDQRTDEAVLADGHHVRVGTSEFEFHLTDQPPTLDSAGDAEELTETVIKNQLVDGITSESSVLAALRD